ncbi:MAG: endolytic transglycosylase MltG [Chitinophagales bacterium]
MRKFLLILFLLVILLGAGFAYFVLVMPNIQSDKRVSLKIPTGSNYQQVLQLLRQNKILKSEFSFGLVSQLKKYPQQVKSGYYTFDPSMNNRQIVNILRAGLQTPVKLVIYNIRTKEEFAGLVGRTLELDSNTLLTTLNDTAFCNRLGVDTNQVLSRFVVDNYEFYWNIPQDKFLEKMKVAFQTFWTPERRAKAKVLNLTTAGVTTLASIVEREVIRDKELVTVAGVYLNRLKIGMPLQADPTLVFALRDFNARRVTAYHKEYDSPYNTYMYVGLPPGPICMPRKKSIDAVLNYENHGYLYFCANPDMSGYSIFSETYDDQIKVAAQYRRKLNEMNIH